jgi:hypothetical protein
MMHPDHYRIIMAMMKAFLFASIAIYSFKLGRLAYIVVTESFP